MEKKILGSTPYQLNQNLWKLTQTVIFFQASKVILICVLRITVPNTSWKFTYRNTFEQSLSSKTQIKS